MNDIKILNNNKQIFYFIFSSPIDIVYQLFIDPYRLYLPGCKILNQKYSQNLDYIGNEITVEITTNSSKVYVYTFKVDKVINLPYYKSFSHKSINHPINCSDFCQTFSSLFLINSLIEFSIFIQIWSLISIK